MTAPTRILIVDDAATVRMYHRKILSDAGWQVDEATNGIEALERVHASGPKNAYGFFVVDVNMPRMDGYSFVRELRRLDIAQQAPVLMVSTEAQCQDASAAFGAGANSYLVKPAKPHDLLISTALLLGRLDVAMGAARQNGSRSGAVGGGAR